jgi:hypothetical protein
MVNQQNGVAGDPAHIGQIAHHHPLPTKMKLIFEGNELVKRHRETEARPSMYQSEVLRTTQTIIALKHVTTSLRQRVKVVTKVNMSAI